MEKQNKKAIIFDMDGTLAESKQPLDSEMASLLKELLHKYYVAVISGAAFPQYNEQFLSNLTLNEEEKKKLLVLPQSGEVMMIYDDNDWKQIYEHEISAEEKKKIIDALNFEEKKFDLSPDKTYGEVIEDRGSQITFSALGQNAPIEAKKDWDPDQTKRTEVRAELEKMLPDENIGIGGMTSLDISEKGIDKAYGIHQISKRLNLPLETLVYVGDALFPGGNDEPALRAGVDCFKVKDVAATKDYIRSLIK